MLVDVEAIADAYRDVGLEPVIEPGAATRSARMYRPDGYPGRVEILDRHHTAQSVSWTDRQSIDYLTYHAPFPVMANTYPHKATPGRIQILAAGPTYTAGRHPAWRDIIGADRGNATGWSMEAPNNGIGERWPSHLQDTIAAATAAELLFFRELGGWADLDWRDPAHFELTSRKIDPWGPCRWNGGMGTFWNMTHFRAEVRRRVADMEETMAIHQIPPFRIDSRTHDHHGTLSDGETRRVALAGVAGSEVPAGASFAVVNVTAVEPPYIESGDPENPRPVGGWSGKGWMTVAASAGDASGLLSTLNFDRGGWAVANGILAPMDPTGAVFVFSSIASDFIIDVTGYVD